MDDVTLLLIFFVSILVGVVVSMLGIGGGVLLVPFLTLVVGVPIQIAIATSLVSTVANSTAASMTYIKAERLNVRLALWFAVTSTVGAVTGVTIATAIDGTLLTEVFAIALFITAILMLLQYGELHPTQATNLHDLHNDRYRLSGSYEDPLTKRITAYHVKRPVLGLISGFFAGNASGLLGIGGGIINVPTMTLGMNVPIKVATATSALIIGMTTAVGAIIYSSRGFVLPLLTAVVIGAVFIGAIIGSRLQGKARNDVLTALFALVLIILGSTMLLNPQ
ncbi:MAG: sulfite exporter TauE/SafE family protein [Halobacteriota archaeon]